MEERGGTHCHQGCRAVQDSDEREQFDELGVFLDFFRHRCHENALCDGVLGEHSELVAIIFNCRVRLDSFLAASVLEYAIKLQYR